MSDTHLNAFKFELEEKKVKLANLQSEVNRLEAFINGEEAAAAPAVEAAPEVASVPEVPAAPVETAPVADVAESQPTNTDGSLIPAPADVAAVDSIPADVSAQADAPAVAAPADVASGVA